MKKNLKKRNFIKILLSICLGVIFIVCVRNYWELSQLQGKHTQTVSQLLEGNKLESYHILLHEISNVRTRFDVFLALFVMLFAIQLLLSKMSAVCVAQNKKCDLSRLEKQLHCLKEERDSALDSLKQQLVTNKDLVEKTTVELEKKVQERTEELQGQTEEVVTQRDELEYQKSIIDAKNKDLLDSLHYARRIQDATLVGRSETIAHFTDAFILYEPKDVISGDFYWVKSIDDYVIFAIGDCTGHGVPGAVLTMLGNSILNQIVLKDKVYDPGQILTKLDRDIKRSFHKTKQQQTFSEGMDISICALNKKEQKMYFAGAVNPLYRVRNGEMNIIAADRYSIGGVRAGMFTYTTHAFDYLPDDVFYMSTDGYYDQFGGKNNKKFMRKRFRNLLTGISSLPFSEQKEILKDEMEQWKGNDEQTDDILVAGFRA